MMHWFELTQELTNTCNILNSFETEPFDPQKKREAKNTIMVTHVPNSGIVEWVIETCIII